MYRSDILRAEKAAQKETIETLANSTGLNPNTISDILNGKAKNPELNSLKKIADALGLTMESIFSESRSAVRSRLAA